MPTLKRSLTVAPLKDAYREELLKYLNSHDGPKAIYWQKTAIAPVNLVVGHSVLKEHGVFHSFIIDPVSMAPIPSTVKTVFFVLHSDLKTVDTVRHFLRLQFSNQSRVSTKYCIIAIPSFSLVCKTFLQEMKVFEQLTAVYELPLTLLPLDTDVLSMEDPNCFADFSLREKETCLFNLARGLMKFQSIFGLFPRIRAKGPKAKRVASMLIQMRQEATVSASLGISDCALNNDVPDDRSKEVNDLNAAGQTDVLLIIDRSVDPLTPCLSQLTYEGLINEVWSVAWGSLKLSPANEGGDSDKKPRRIVLNTGDPLFGEIRDQNFAHIGATLSRRTKELSSIIDETKHSKDLANLRRVVNQLPELRQIYASASQHMNLAEILQDYATSDEFVAGFRAQQDLLAGYDADKPHPLIEERILQLAPIEEILRLICIQSFCSGGLRKRILDQYRHEILQTYGFQYMITLDNLERLGLLEDSYRVANLAGLVDMGATSRITTTTNTTVPQGRTSMSAVKRTVVAVSAAYSTCLRRNLRLQAPPETSAENGATSLDVSLGRLFGGTLPISVRLVQAMAFGWPSRSLSTGIGQAPFTSALGSAATSAYHAGRRLLGASSSPASGRRTAVVPGGSYSTNGGSSSGGYVTSLLHTVEVDEMQVPPDSESTSKVGTGNIATVKTVVVAFVGGVTHSEISALRKVAAADDGRVDFIFVTTGFISWKSFIASLVERIQVAELTS